MKRFNNHNAILVRLKKTDKRVSRLEATSIFRGQQLNRLEEASNSHGQQLNRLEESDKSHVKRFEEMKTMLDDNDKKNAKFQDLTMKHMAKLTQEITEIKNDTSETRAWQEKSDNRVTKIEIAIEHDIPNKFAALFDGQNLILEKLERIEDKLTQHDEILLRRIK